MRISQKNKAIFNYIKKISFDLLSYLDKNILMKSLNEIVGENLTFLRKKAGYTQLEFGDKFSYSDKTVSKWENGSVLHLLMF